VVSQVVSGLWQSESWLQAVVHSALVVSQLPLMQSVFAEQGWQRSAPELPVEPPEQAQVPSEPQAYPPLSQSSALPQLTLHAPARHWPDSQSELTEQPEHRGPTPEPVPPVEPPIEPPLPVVLLALPAMGLHSQ